MRGLRSDVSNAAPPQSTAAPALPIPRQGSGLLPALDATGSFEQHGALPQHQSPAALPPFRPLVSVRLHNSQTQCTPWDPFSTLQAIARAREGAKSIDAAKPDIFMPAPSKQHEPKSATNIAMEASAARRSTAESDLSLRKQESRNISAQEAPLPRPAPPKERLQGRISLLSASVNLHLLEIVHD